ncbi:MAG TPA: hypothetical protein VEL28_18265 [Candidatus Binatia bacterium]|nr:hypothetical protein [Candidatus Binatia bacterium]
MSARHAIGAAAALMALLASSARAEFRPVDIYVDAGEVALAAYQVEVRAAGATIVGVEGGEHAAFAEPAYYDPAALSGGRIILAAFSTGHDLPGGRTRVATLHMHESSEARYEVKLMAAGDAGGRRTRATVSVVSRETQR